MSKSRGVTGDLTLTVPQVVDYLRQLAEGIEGGSVYVEHGGEVVSLEPRGVIEVEIEAKQKKDRERLALELTWRTQKTGATLEPGLKISTGDPRSPA
jgi:amphi-Trp domain-containing protein